MLEDLSINQAFCIKYELDIKDGLLVGALNAINNDLTVDECLKLVPGISNKRDTLQRRLKSLKEKGVLRSFSMSDQEAYIFLKKGDFESSACHFCGFSGCSLHQHHYPIRNKDGGKETIPLCPNCHSLFHDLVDHNIKYSLSEKYKAEWNLSESEWAESGL